MSLTPAQDELEARKKREAIELCGKNRGPHDYIPIEWKLINDIGVQGELYEARTKRVTRFLCRVCFCNVETQVLLESYKEIKL